MLGTAPVTIESSTSTPLVGTTFTSNVVVDLTAVTGALGGSPVPAGLSAFRIPITFDRTRLQLVSVAPAAGTPFTTAPLSATAIADANVSGGLTVAATIGGGTAPAGRFAVVTITLSANASGPANLSGDAPSVSLASAIQPSGAVVYGPAAIPPKPGGGGVTVQTPPSLRLSMTAGPVPAINGGQLVYTLHLENNGGSPARGASIAATAPAPFAFT